MMTFVYELDLYCQDDEPADEIGTFRTVIVLQKEATVNITTLITLLGNLSYELNSDTATIRWRYF